MAKKRRFDFTKKNKRSGKVENVGYLDLEQDEEQSRCSLYFYGDIVSATWESMWYEEDRCPQDIADFLNQLDGYEDIDIYFNSGGGDVFAGLAIYNQLKRYDGHKQEFFSCWCDVKSLGTNEKYNALQIGLENTIVFETRACDKMEEIRLNLKEFYAVYKGIEFKIYDACPMFTDDRKYQLKCRAGA